MTKQLKAITVATAAVAIIGGVTYAVYQGERTHDLQFHSNGHLQSKSDIKGEAACQNLDGIIIENLKHIIDKGESAFKYPEWVSNIQTNVSAMKMNRCKNDNIYAFIQSKYTINDEMYYKLQNLIE